jgi:hypothetical protein
VARKAVWRSTGMLFSLGLTFGIVAVRFDFPALAWVLGPVLVVVQWLLAVAIAVFLLLHRPGWRYGISSLLNVAFIVPFFFPLPPLMERIGEVLTEVMREAGWFLPAGWAVKLYGRLVLDDQWKLCPLLIPIVLVAGSLSYSWRRLRAKFVTPAWILEFWPEHSPAPAHAVAGPAEIPGLPAARPTEIKDRLAARDFLRPGDWAARGFIERLVHGWLTPRQRVIADFMLGGQVDWTRQLRAAFLFAAAGMALAWWLPQVREMALIFSSILAVSTGVAGNWRGFGPAAAFGLQIPIYAVLPVGFREFAPVFFKANTVRLAAFLPVTTAFGGLAMMLFGYPVMAGLIFGLKLGLLLLLWQPVILVFHFSSGTNDTQKSSLFAVAVFIIFLILAGLSAVVLFTPPLIAGIGGLLLLGAVLGAFRLYRKKYERGHFDLVHAPAAGTMEAQG